MKYDILTLFPEIFDSYLNESILGRAQKNKKIQIKIHDIRKNAIDKHNTADDKPYGGGPGMVMMIEPIYKTLKKIRRKKNSKVILLSARGKTWTQQRAQKYKKLDQLILICGHYEGVDERIKNFIDEEISIGDYVLTGGELGAMVLVDSISRLIPGVLGKKESLKEESHSQKGYLEYPQYTRPEIFKAGGKKYAVPEILLSGHHLKINEWRQRQSKKFDFFNKV
ncbi:MAG TPA: tRNA (guanosine(37)-N1)-methyltransferase TrmD [Candidatus Bipolaricaulota bacterium]|nr:tRNA (guanosine(37)-N1)-methyltransferase TrmD [Candidatus Bipolaricaulota bacterium]